MSKPASDRKIEPIDLQAVFYSKNPKLAALIPRFVFRYLNRIVHVKEINGFLKEHGEKQNLDFINAAIKDFNVSIKTEGTENIPAKGRFIFAANHPLGGFDGIVLMKIISNYFIEFKFLVNDLLMNLKNIRDLFIPINKHGKQALEAAAILEKTYESDTQILTFPAGLVSRKIKGQIMDLPWHKNFISKAIKHQRDIIPVHFSGRNTNFFYRLANLRKFLGIKANIEMLYLVDETYKHKNEELVVKFGEPVSWKTFDNSKKPVEWAKWVKERVYALDGVYHVPV
jgi:1-acyl-sn-glycerol-3-phosphate acyltransferase